MSILQLVSAIRYELSNDDLENLSRDKLLKESPLFEFLLEYVIAEHKNASLFYWCAKVEADTKNK